MSLSLKEGKRGAFTPSKACAWRGAGMAGSCGAFGRDVGEERLARNIAGVDEGLSFPAENVGGVVTVTVCRSIF